MLSTKLTQYTKITVTVADLHIADHCYGNNFLADLTTEPSAKNSCTNNSNINLRRAISDESKAVFEL